MYNLNDIRKYCVKCEKCRLSKTRNNIVFGEGNENADIMLVGEGPGYYEDMNGVPFIGKAGKLLDKMLFSVDLRREDIYISNIVKCRPPNNRNPETDEQDACIEYLRWQVKLIKPKIIVCLGSVAAKRLIDKNKTISSMRGKIVKKSDISFIATYHPSYLLRNEAAKKYAWNDLKLIKQEYNRIKEME